MMWILKIFLIFVVNEVFCQIGDKCSTYDGRAGFIKSHKDCEYVREQQEKRNHNEIKKLRRVFGAGLILFCCPLRKAMAQCNLIGKRPEKYVDTSVVSRIIGGATAEIAEFPHFAALGKIEDGKLAYRCGGTLISNTFVLTAAHCSEISDPPVIVLLGKVSRVIM
jgi:Trypsin